MTPDDIRELFLQELEEQAALLALDLLKLEGDEVPAEVLDGLFRAAHSLKGAAQVTGMRAIADVAHGMESVFSAVRANSLVPDSGLVTALLGAVDWLRGAAQIVGLDQEPDGRTARNLRASLCELAATEPEALPPPSLRPVPKVDPEQGASPAPAPAVRAPDTVRVAARKLDALLAQASEITVARQRLEGLDHAIGRVATELAEHDVRWRHLSAALLTAPHLDSETLMALETMDSSWQRTIAAVSPLAARATGAERDLRLAAEPLVDQVLDLRTIPFAHVAEGLERVVRDAAGRAGKQVVLSLQGGAVEVDRSVAVALREPLIHLVHNAIDHGIEPAAARQAAGKAPAGRITVTAEIQGDRVHVTVSDDGAGLRPETIRAAAARAGLLQPDGDDDLIQAVFTPGLSTSPAVTETSGRGVGLDAVRARIDGLGGSVQLFSEPGVGTAVTLVAPITLSILHTITVSVADQVVMLSSAGVQRVVRADPAAIRVIGDWPTLAIDGKHVRLVDLARGLGWPDSDIADEGTLAVVIVESAGKQVGLVVSKLLAEAEVTMHALCERVGGAPAVVGVSLLPEGGVAVVLSAVACARLGAATPAAVVRPDREADTVAVPRILLAEDTLTTRALEQGILEAAGYEVLPAVDGADAWRQLRERGADLVVSDVNMPRMDGFELCAAIRSSGRFEHLPVVLVTSLSQETDRRRGLEVGANAYLVKAEFNQGVLVDTIQRLLR